MQRVLLIPELSAEQEHFWHLANRDVIWGWKRDVGNQSRMIYYSAKLQKEGKAVYATRQYLFYKHRTDPATAEQIQLAFSRGSEALELVIGPPCISRQRFSARETETIRVEIGRSSQRDRELVSRLSLRRARSRIVSQTDALPRKVSDANQLFPADLYIGSGVSYEAKIPTLCDMHQAFCVDDLSREEFAVGKADWLPFTLSSVPEQVLRDFCAVHSTALQAEPTPALQTVALLYEAGLVGRVFTDNVDNLIAKVGVPFERVRGSGVLNERYCADFTGRVLLVVGVAADRRQIVRQARGRGGTIAIVNPCMKVSPKVQHLNYLRPRDLFLKTTADRFFAEVRGQLGLTLRKEVSTGASRNGSDYDGTNDRIEVFDGGLFS